MDSFLAVAGQVGVLFALMGVGAVCRIAGLIGEKAAEGMVNLLIIVVTPCLIVDVFSRPFDPSMSRGLLNAFLFACAAHCVGILLARILLRRGPDSTRRVLRMAVVFSNAGFMGIPLEHAVLGDGGVFYGAVYVAVFNLFMWSWGLRTMQGEGANFVRMLVNPGTVGLAVGLPVFFFSVRLPGAVAVPVRMIADMNTPLAMVVIGHCLAGAKLAPVARMDGAYAAAALRLVVVPAAVLAIMFPFRGSLPREMMLALVIASSAPVAAMVSMLASKYGRDIDASVGLVSGTTLLSAFTMPVVVAVAMNLL